MTNGNEAERGPVMHSAAQATEEMAAMAAQRRAEEAVLRDAQVVLANTEWNSLTPQEQEAQIAEEETHLDQRRGELEEDIERYASDPRARDWLGPIRSEHWRASRARPAGHLIGHDPGGRQQAWSAFLAVA
jgi:hypothetical protein